MRSSSRGAPIPGRSLRTWEPPAASCSRPAAPSIAIAWSSASSIVAGPMPPPMALRKCSPRAGRTGSWAPPSSAATLASMLPLLGRLASAPEQVIVVDGAASEATAALCRGAGCAWMPSARGRGLQLAAGIAAARAAGAGALWMVHADCEPHASSAHAIREALAAGAAGGYFRFRFGGARSALKRSEEHTSELQSPCNLVCRLLLEKKKKNTPYTVIIPGCLPLHTAPSPTVWFGVSTLVDGPIAFYDA